MEEEAHEEAEKEEEEDEVQVQVERLLLPRIMKMDCY